jgi:hypothetical protein
MSCGLVSPNYVRSATFNNTTDAEVTVAATFQSGHTQSYAVAAGASQVVERDFVAEGSEHTSVDPLTGFAVTVGGNTANGDFAGANGVEVRTYNIGANGVTTVA